MHGNFEQDKFEKVWFDKFVQQAQRKHGAELVQPHVKAHLLALN
jgi:hypothetical protein